MDKHGNPTGNNSSSSASPSDTGVLENSHRSGVVGSENGAMFTIGFQDNSAKDKSKQIPKRLQQYQAQQKTTTKADILNKQKLAEERKKKFDEQKAAEARKVSEQAMKFDKLMRAELKNAENQQKWYHGAMPK